MKSIIYLFSYNFLSFNSENDQMKIDIFLYDAAGNDEKVELKKLDIDNLKEKQLLWINILQRDEETLNNVVSALKLENVPSKTIINKSRRPKIDNFESFFQFCIDSVVTKKGKPFEKISIDFIVGKNFVVTIHEGDVDYFVEFRKREKGETLFGELDAESFVATLLDLHIVSYFQAMEEIDRQVDDLDEKVLKRGIETDEFLTEMVRLRRDVSKLRRWLIPHREVIYSLSRADFQQIAESDSLKQYQMLNQHFENAVDALGNLRETVLSIFELYATTSVQETNSLIRRLTFFTLLAGSLAVIAGVFGMNYQLSYFEAEPGFWYTVGGMAFITLTLTIIARLKCWI